MLLAENKVRIEQTAVDQESCLFKPAILHLVINQEHDFAVDRRSLCWKSVFHFVSHAVTCSSWNFLEIELPQVYLSRHLEYRSAAEYLKNVWPIRNLTRKSVFEAKFEGRKS